jgi:hypothetical protein
MIVSVWKEDNDVQCTTNGCGCCSVNLYGKSDRGEIIDEIKQNIKVAKEVCKLMKIDFNSLL